ncbi:MAG: hypothetical protein ABEJ93_02830 [Candidatus Nanohalobium sp.]
MKKLYKKALLYFSAGMLTVIGAGFITNLVAPQNALGEGLRFSVPLLTGVIGGAVIFFRLKDESDTGFSELEEG